MCNFSGRLVAWMDGELAEHEAAEVERHVAACAECRASVVSYEEASQGFAAYYDSATQTAPAAKPHRKLPRWVPVAVATAAAAAIVLLALLPRAAKTGPQVPQEATAAAPSIAPEISSTPLKPAAKRHVVARRKAPAANWAMADPAIQIAIPADSMFPPGAVPEGVNFVASLSLADGSVQAIRLQP
ncbi:MAG: zf-HC2 domain-containing protein [Candidatus Korobacteraceae bacterium]